MVEVVGTELLGKIFKDSTTLKAGLRDKVPGSLELLHGRIQLVNLGLLDSRVFVLDVNVPLEHLIGFGRRHFASTDKFTLWSTHTKDRLGNSVGKVLSVDRGTHDAMEQFMSDGVLLGPLRVDKDVRVARLVLLDDETFPAMVLRRVSRVFSTKHTASTVRVKGVD